ncbi:universal stress protein [Thioalkalivibrio sp. AKL19]|uniref:universal stress protein n=1 Tax=Thioalkalivibrio sp. AKL19 TaxID=1266914 RepID=UPI000416B539|nr:universal stress protein [Thioalkalivibrio sp. AKL19]
MELKTMLVPVDGSANAWRAVEVAADLASKYRARVVLVSVLLQGEVPPHIRKLSDLPDADDPPLAMGGAAVGSAVPPKVLRDIAKKLVDQAHAYFTEMGVADIEHHIEDGSPAKVILQQAEYHDVDMVVMGSRGLGGLQGLLSGSVSHKVQQLARCIVVTVN